MNLDVSRAIAPRAGATVSFDGDALPVEAAPFVSFAALVQALRRRWRLWMTTVLGGMMLAMAVSVAFPPPHTATTILFLRHSAEADPSRAMATDAELLTTRTIAQAVIDRLSLELTPEELISKYSATALSDSLLQISMHGSTADEAVRRADELAAEFLRFRRRQFEQQLQVVIDILEERNDALTAELDALTDRIDSFGPRSDLSTLSDLLTRRATVATELAELGRRIDDIRIDIFSAVENSRIVDTASETDRSPLATMVANMLAGIVGGLALGAGWVVVAEVVSDRVRRRQDVTLSLGAPVAVSIGPLRGPLWAQRRRFRRHLATPRGDLSQVVRHLRGLLQADSMVRPLVVVSVDSEGPAALVVGLTAVELVNEGKNVLVVDLSRRSAMAALLKVPAGQTSTLGFDQSHSKLWLAYPSAESQDAHEDGLLEFDVKPDIVIALATLDPALGAWHLLKWATTVVSLVTAGRSTRTALRSTAQMIRAAGLKLASTVLVEADPSDESVGIPDNFFPRPSREGPALPANQ